MNNLIEYYKDETCLNKMLKIITGDCKISLRIVDWFATNYAKKYFTLFDIEQNGQTKRFKVYTDYKLKLKAYSKRRFDPFCRWDRISIPYKDGTCIETTIGQLNFFKWFFSKNLHNLLSEPTLCKKIEKEMTKICKRF